MNAILMLTLETLWFWWHAAHQINKKLLEKINKLYWLPVSAFSLICKQVMKCFFYFFSCLFLAFAIQLISMWDLTCRMNSLRYERIRMWGVLAHLTWIFQQTLVFAKAFSKLAREVKQAPPKTNEVVWILGLGTFFC